MGMSAGGSGGGINDINITPLVDVVLVLLIIFIVIAPQLQKGVEVKLPEIAKHRKVEKQSGGEEEKFILVSVQRTGEVFIGKEPVQRDNFIAAMRTALQKQENIGRRILLRGDSNVSYGAVREVMDKFQELGQGGVLLSVKEEAKLGQHEQKGNE